MQDDKHNSHKQGAETMANRNSYKGNPAAEGFRAAKRDAQDQLATLAA